MTERATHLRADGNSNRCLLSPDLSHYPNKSIVCFLFNLTIMFLFGWAGGLSKDCELSGGIKIGLVSTLIPAVRQQALQACERLD